MTDMKWYSWIFWFPQYHLLILLLVVWALWLLLKINYKLTIALKYLHEIWRPK